MREFFKPRRRKLGVATLSVACLLMAGWVRSDSTADFAHSPLWSGMANSVMSHKSMIYYGIGQASGNVRLPGWTASPTENTRLAWREKELWWEYRDQTTGIGVYGTTDSHPFRTKVFCVPYWTFVAPLTLLSAFLLLRTPRPRRTHSDDTKADQFLR